MSTILGAIVVVALLVYALTGGADFGGGVWDLLATGPRKGEQRKLIAKAIAPIWEANHVWLILVVVLGFVCFPEAFRRVMVHLHVPLTLLLVGIVLRGAAFVFRAYDPAGPSEVWGRVFAVSSLLTPFMLGVCLGAMLAGLDEDLILGWATPTALWVGLVVTALFSFLAAVYLCVESEALAEDFRRRALGSGLALGLVALPAVWSLRAQPIFSELAGAWSFHVATGVTAVTALWALWTRRYRVARIAAMAQCSAMVLGWGFAQYPLVLPPDLTLEEAAAPPTVLRMTLIVLSAGSVLLVPAFVWLYRLFKTR